MVFLRGTKDIRTPTISRSLCRFLKKAKYYLAKLFIPGLMNLKVEVLVFNNELNEMQIEYSTDF